MEVYIDVPVADVDQACTLLRHCVGHVNSRFMSRRLKLNDGKTNSSGSGPKPVLPRCPQMSRTCKLALRPFMLPRPSAILAHCLTLNSDISRAANSCLYQLRRLREVIHLVGCEVTAQCWSLRLCSRDLATVTPSWQVYHGQPSSHSSEYSTPLCDLSLVWERSM